MPSVQQKLPGLEDGLGVASWPSFGAPSADVSPLAAYLDAAPLIFTPRVTISHTLGQCL